MIEHDQQVPHKRQEQRRARAVRHDVLVAQNAADRADEVRAERRGLGAAPLLAELPPVARQAAPPPPPHLALGVLDARLEHFPVAAAERAFIHAAVALRLFRRRGVCSFLVAALKGERWLLAEPALRLAARR